MITAIASNKVTLEPAGSMLTVVPPVSPTSVPSAGPAPSAVAGSGSLLRATVNIPNLAAMTRLDGSAAAGNPGLTSALPMPPPGYTVVGDDNVNLGLIETFPISDWAAEPISTGSPLPNVNLGNRQEAFPISDPVLPNVVMATSPDVQAAQKGYPGVGVTPNGGPTFAGTDYLYPVDGNQKNIVSDTSDG